MASLLVAFGMSAATAGTVASVATVAGAGIGAAGALQQGAAAKAQGKSQQSMANYNALVQEREAEAVKMKAGFEQRRQAERGRRIKSAQTVAMAKAGGLGSPVATDLAAEQAKELELENLLIGYSGEVGAQRALSQAALDRMQGKMSRRKGKSAREASYYQAGSTLLTGFGSAG